MPPNSPEMGNWRNTQFEATATVTVTTTNPHFVVFFTDQTQFLYIISSLHMPQTPPPNGRLNLKQKYQNVTVVVQNFNHDMQRHVIVQGDIDTHCRQFPPGQFLPRHFPHEKLAPPWFPPSKKIYNLLHKKFQNISYNKLPPSKKYFPNKPHGHTPPTFSRTFPVIRQPSDNDSS